MGAEIMVDSPLVGRHQLRNLALAITAAEQLSNFGFRIRPEHVEAGIRNTDWRARFQVVPRTADFPETILDVAHNPAGAWALRSALSSFYEDRRLTFVFGVMRDKAVREIAEILFPMAEHVIVTRADSPRAASVEEIAAAAAHTGTDIIPITNVHDALERGRELTDKKGVLVITGSIYIVGEALRLVAQAMPQRSISV